MLADERLAALRHAGRRADLSDRREHARQRAAIDDHGRMPSAPSLRRAAFGPSWTTTRSGRARRSSRHPASGTCRPSAASATSGGNRQKVETPTTRSPRPSANSVSVMLGDVETMRAGIAAAGPRRCHDEQRVATTHGRRSRRQQPSPDARRAGIARHAATMRAVDPSRTALHRASRYQARENRLPVLPVTSRSEPLTPASCSSLRPNSHNRSDRRLT